MPGRTTGPPGASGEANDLQPEPVGPTVPYITRWSGEENVGRAQLRLGVTGLYYTDERPADRDAHGVLWARTANAPGRGRPEYRQVNGLRQRDAMLRLRCQVCAGPASHTPKGTLFLLEETLTNGSDLEDDVTGQPPLCLVCARLASRQCPILARRCTALRARKSALYGVACVPYLPSPHGPVSEGRWLSLPYGTGAVRYVLAYQLLRQLRRVTVVELEVERPADVAGSG